MSDAFNPDGDNVTITCLPLSSNGDPVDSSSLGVSPCRVASRQAEQLASRGSRSHSPLRSLTTNWMLALVGTPPCSAETLTAGVQLPSAKHTDAFVTIAILPTCLVVRYTDALIDWYWQWYLSWHWYCAHQWRLSGCSRLHPSLSSQLVSAAHPLPCSTCSTLLGRYSAPLLPLLCSCLFGYIHVPRPQNLDPKPNPNADGH